MWPGFPGEFGHSPLLSRHEMTDVSVGPIIYYTV
jgi:hypothetical protein